MKQIPKHIEEELARLSAQFSNLCKENGIAGVAMFEAGQTEAGIRYFQSGGIPPNRKETWPFPIAFSIIAARYPELQDALIRACCENGIWPGPPEYAPANSFPELPDHRGLKTGCTIRSPRSSITIMRRARAESVAPAARLSQSTSISCCSETVLIREYGRGS